jgi:tRNA(fMet)-specific endonuclease VapC
MTKGVLLDTSAAVELLLGNLSVQRVLVPYEDVFLSTTALGELLHGAYKSARREQNLAEIEDLSDGTVFLECDAGTALHYAEVKYALRRRGRPLPENDIWIAAVARQHDLALATSDAHFEQVAGLQLVTW